MRVQLPSSGLVAGPAAIQVSSGGGDSGTVPITISPCTGDTAATSTPTPTLPAPTLTNVSPSTGLACNSTLTLTGNNFGSPPSSLGTTAFLISSGPLVTLRQIGTGSNTSMVVQIPNTGVTAGQASVQVSNTAGDSTRFTVTVASGCA
jgi:IPT/TIG domain-containing protein